MHLWAVFHKQAALHNSRVSCIMDLHNTPSGRTLHLFFFFTLLLLALLPAGICQEQPAGYLALVQTGSVSKSCTTQVDHAAAGENEGITNRQHACRQIPRRDGHRFQKMHKSLSSLCMLDSRGVLGCSWHRSDIAKSQARALLSSRPCCSPRVCLPPWHPPLGHFVCPDRSPNTELGSTLAEMGAKLPVS